MKLSEKTINRIVVRSTNWVGDTVMSVAALRRLRHSFPSAHITLVARPWARDVLMDIALFDNLMLYQRRSVSIFRQIKEWRRHEFDLAVLFQNAFEAALIPFLARVPLRIGYSTDRRGALLTHPLPVPDWRDRNHEVFYYLNIVLQLEALLGRGGDNASVDLDCSLTVSATRKSQALERLRAEGLQENRSLIVLCPGSINSRAKRWPADRYAKLADRLIEEHGAEILLIGSEQETDVATLVRAGMKRRLLDLTGKTRLAEAVALLSVADLVISNDTGPAHIAAALGRPTLVIFGPTNPLTTRPYSSTATVVREPPDCAPCMLRDCPIDHRCMTAISVEEIVSRSVALLAVPKNETVNSRLKFVTQA